MNPKILFGELKRRNV